MQLPAHPLGKTTAEFPGAGVPATPMGGLDEVPRSWLSPGYCGYLESKVMNVSLALCVCLSLSKLKPVARNSP